LYGDYEWLNGGNGWLNGDYEIGVGKKVVREQKRWWGSKKVVFGEEKLPRELSRAGICTSWGFVGSDDVTGGDFTLGDHGRASRGFL